MTDKLKQLCEFASSMGGDRDILFTITPDEALELELTMDDYVSIPNHSEFTEGISGNIQSYRYLNVTLHLKVKK